MINCCAPHDVFLQSRRVNAKICILYFDLCFAERNARKVSSRHHPYPFISVCCLLEDTRTKKFKGPKLQRTSSACMQRRPVSRREDDEQRQARIFARAVMGSLLTWGSPATIAVERTILSVRLTQITIYDGLGRDAGYNPGEVGEYIAGRRGRRYFVKCMRARQPSVLRGISAYARM